MEQNKSCDISVLTISSRVSERNSQQGITLAQRESQKVFQTPGLEAVDENAETPEFIGEGKDYLRQYPIPE